MKKKIISIGELAKEVGRSTDDVLIILWENHYDEIKNEKDKLYGKSLDRAREILGVVDHKKLKKVKYWLDMFSLSYEEFCQLCKRHGIFLSQHKSNVPDGNIRILKRLVKNYYDDSGKEKQGQDKEEKKSLEVKETYELEIVGHECDVRFLSQEEVVGIHYELVKDFAKEDDPISPAGPRNEDLLASAIYRQHTSNGGILKYPTLEMATAALLHSLIHNHPFHNGNKRTALVSMLAMLDKNNFTVESTKCTEDDLFKMVMEVAKHNIVDYIGTHLPDKEVEEISKWIKKNIRLTKKGERPVQFRTLRGILNNYDCIMECGKTGSKIKITREIPRGRWLFFPKKLATNIYYGGEGKEVGRDTINKIRSDLELDDDHGVDSEIFYNVRLPIDEFISRYRKTLKRLSKL